MTNFLLAQAGAEFYFLFIFLALVVIILLSIIGKFISLWFQAFVSGTPIALFNIIGMSLRKIPPRIIVQARITAYKAGLKTVTVNDLETHYLAGGNVSAVVSAMIAAEKANISLDWKQATAIDLAGRDIQEAIRTSVNPKVIDCPAEGFNTGVSKDGIQMHVRARVTVRTNIMQLVGGATEETIIARVGEGMVSAIGQAELHAVVLEAPWKISQQVLDRGLDASTAFMILSIDITKVELGRNIGAELRAQKAESDKKIAQAKAEERRAMAVAAEQENKAKLVEAEAAVPIAMAEAFKKGNMGIMDYQRIRNIQSDTDMRKSIAGSDDDNQTPKAGG